MLNAAAPVVGGANWSGQSICPLCRWSLVDGAAIFSDFHPHTLVDLPEGHCSAAEAFGFLPPLCVRRVDPVGPERAVLTRLAVISHSDRVAHLRLRPAHQNRPFRCTVLASKPRLSAGLSWNDDAVVVCPPLCQPRKNHVASGGDNSSGCRQISFVVGVAAFSRRCWWSMGIP